MKLPLGVAAVVLVAATLTTGCTRDDPAAGDTEPPVGVLTTADLPGDGWHSTDDSGGSRCGSLAAPIRSMSGVSDASAVVSHHRDEVTVVSIAWIALGRSGTRPHDFDRLRSHADSCAPLTTDSNWITQFEFVEDEPDQFVVHERRFIRNVAGGADQLYFREGPVVGMVAVVFDGDRAPMPVEDLGAVARQRALELAPDRG